MNKTISISELLDTTVFNVQIVKEIEFASWSELVITQTTGNKIRYVGKDIKVTYKDGNALVNMSELYEIGYIKGVSNE